MSGRHHEAVAVFLCLAWLVLDCSAAVAAKIERVINPYCSVKLSGPIEKGDTARLSKIVSDMESESTSNKGGKAVAARVKPDPYQETKVSVCLHSSGGNFDEALELIKFFYGEESPGDVGTVIDRGNVCRGPCAYVFMAGRNRPFHDLNLPLRRLHVGGTLAFGVPTAEGDSRSTAELYRNGVRMLGALTKVNAIRPTGAEVNQPFPQSLLVEAMKLGPGDFVEVDVLAKALRWNIQLIGYVRPTTVSLAQLHQGCVNVARYWNSPVGPGEHVKPSSDPLPLKNVFRARFKGFDHGGAAFCLADAYRSAIYGLNVDFTFVNKLSEASAAKGLIELVENPNGDFTSRGLDAGQSSWFLLSPETKLRTIVAP